MRPNGITTEALKSRIGLKEVAGINDIGDDGGVVSWIGTKQVRPQQRTISGPIPQQRQDDNHPDQNGDLGG